LKDNQKQIVKYTLIGVSAVLIDLLVYYGVSFVIDSISLAKASGFIVGSLYTFYFNKYWTWKEKEKTNVSQFSRFAVIYGISLLINIVVNQISLDVIPQFEIFIKIQKPNGEIWFSFWARLDKFIAFGISTLASAFWNFLGQKYWVFKKGRKSKIEIEI
jgi:putative flippase GtrA